MIPNVLNKHTNSTAFYQTRQLIVSSNNHRAPLSKTYSYLSEYQIDIPLENHHNWFDNCPIAQTRKESAFFSRRLLTRYKEYFEDQN